jgi:hypothetical protein
MSYIYAIVVDDVVRYIGKGTGRRAKWHVRKMHQILRARAVGEVVRALHLHNRMAKAWREGSNIEIEILIDGLTHDAAFAKEMEIIASFPQGQLWNKTLGGDKPPVRSHDMPHRPESVEKIRATNIKTWSDQELRAKQSADKKVHWLNPEYRKKLIALQTGKPKPSVSAKAKERWAQPGFKERVGKAISLAQIGKKKGLYKPRQKKEVVQ